MNDMQNIFDRVNYSGSISQRMLKGNNSSNNRRDFQLHLQDIKKFISSFENTSVSLEIMGEWNIIRKEINDYLFNINIEFDGGCSKLSQFYFQELKHLNSIKSKLGPNAIEYQMICSIVAEAIIQDVKSSIIQVKIMYGLDNISSKMAYNKMLKDCLNLMEDVASLEMEYQYKYEVFNPFHNSLKSEGRKVGLVYIKPDKNEKGCMSVIILIIVSTFLCSFCFL